MAVILVAEPDDTLGPGVYWAMVVGVQERLRNGQTFLLRKLQIGHGDRVVSLTYPIPTRTTPANRRGRLLSALLGRAIQPGERIAVIDLIGLGTRIKVERTADGCESSTCSRMLCSVRPRGVDRGPLSPQWRAAFDGDRRECLVVLGQRRREDGRQHRGPGARLALVRIAQILWFHRGSADAAKLRVAEVRPRPPSCRR
jgi:hypothetical protein